MSIKIQKAVKSLRPLKMCLSAPSGAGKTYSALAVASGLGEKILLIDSENKSSMLYADQFNFDVGEIDPNDPNMLNTFQEYLEIGKKDYDVIIVDSLSVYWNFTLEKKSKIDMAGGDSFRNWGKITPEWNKLLASIVAYPKHMICTLREKTDYVLEQNEKGKMAPRKVGLAPIFREGAEYEFDIFAKIDLNHNMLIEKTRLSYLVDSVISHPGKEFGERAKKFLTEGAYIPPAPEPVLYDLAGDDKEIEAKRIDWATKNGGKLITGAVFSFTAKIANPKLDPYYKGLLKDYKSETITEPVPAENQDIAKDDIN